MGENPKPNGVAWEGNCNPIPSWLAGEYGDHYPGYVYFSNQDEIRKMRRDGIKLVAVGVVCVAAGIVVILIGNFPLGFFGALLFATLIPIGVWQARRPGEDLPLSIGIIGSLGFVAFGVMAIIVGAFDIGVFGRRQMGALPVGVIGVAFFGTAAILLIRRAIKRGRSNR